VTESPPIRKEVGAGSGRHEQRVLRWLQELTAAYSKALTPASIAQITVGQAAKALGADAALAVLAEDGDLVVEASRGYPQDALQGLSRFSAEMPTPLADAIRSNEVVWIASDEELADRYPGMAGALALPMRGATAATPIRVRGRAVGAVSFSLPAGRALDEADRSFLVALGERFGQALERARAYVSEREERDRQSFLVEASRLLTSSLDRDETLRELARLAVPRVADWCAIDMLRPDGTVEMVAAEHIDPAKVRFAEQIRRSHPPRPEDPMGVSRVIRTGEPELVTNVQQGHPDLPELVRKLDLRSVMTVPLTVNGEAVGAARLAAAESGRRYDEEDLSLAVDLARIASAAITNARLYEAERLARRAAEEARRRLTLLAEAGAAFASTLQYDSVLEILTNVATAKLADWCVVFLAGPEGRIERVASAHRDPVKSDLVREMAETHFPEPDEDQSLVMRAIASGEPAFVPNVGNDFYDRVLSSPEQRALARRIGIRSLIVVPLLARGRSLGALVLVRSIEPQPFDDDDLQFALELSRRAALALDNSRLYGERDRVAATLQRSLLPPALPRIPGIEIGEVYRPAEEGIEVGGDFYDVFQTSPSDWTIVVGDVCGKGPAAAAMMGLSRYTIRTAAMSERRPSRILSVLNSAMLQQDEEQRFCTVCCGRLHTGLGRARLTLSCGGHPLPFLHRADGSLESVGNFGPLVGAFDDVDWHDVVVDLAPGDLCVFYTDGVTDDRQDPGGFGEETLKRVIRSSSGLDAQTVADRIVAEVVGVLGSPRDDIAVLTLRCTGEQP
jgi:serine phosphatase RsbU (regulator of sigma subunit)